MKCFQHSDDTIRELSSHAVLLTAQTELGRVTIVANDLVKIVAELFDDSVTQIRDNAYSCLINLAEFTYGIKSVIDKDILPVLVDKLVAESEENILILILRLLNICLEGELATGLCLNTHILQRLNGHLKSTNHEIRRLAAESLGSISYDEVGKLATLEAESITPLCEMLTDPIPTVRVSAVRTLCSLAQLKDGKVQIYDLDKLNTIIMLLYDIEEQTRLNTIQLISMVAEYPPAREKFKQALEKLQQMTKLANVSPLIAQHAEVAIQVITWVP